MRRAAKALGKSLLTRGGRAFKKPYFSFLNPAYPRSRKNGTLRLRTSIGATGLRYVCNPQLNSRAVASLGSTSERCRYSIVKSLTEAPQETTVIMNLQQQIPEADSTRGSTAQSSETPQETLQTTTDVESTVMVNLQQQQTPETTPQPVTLQTLETVTNRPTFLTVDQTIRKLEPEAEELIDKHKEHQTLLPTESRLKVSTKQRKSWKRSSVVARLQIKLYLRNPNAFCLRYYSTKAGATINNSAEEKEMADKTKKNAPTPNDKTKEVAPTSNDDNDLAAKLRNLSQFKGLIPDAEYEARMKQLLDQATGTKAGPTLGVLPFLLKQPLKQNLREYQGLAANKADFGIRERKEAQVDTITIMAKRMMDIRRFSKGELSSKEARQYHPLITTYTPPGGGKSFFMDYIVDNLTEEDLELEKDGEVSVENLREMYRILKESWRVPVTFNSGSEYGPFYADGVSGDVALGMRVAYTSFVDRDKLSFGQFDKRCREANLKITLVDALEAIKKHLKEENPKILLLVDEIIKVKNEERRNEVLATIGSILSTSTENFNCLLSTLDILKITQTQSGREVVRVPLPLLSVESSLDLFKRYGTDGVNKCAVSCNGHPRSLEQLRLTLNKVSPEASYSTLMASLAEKVGDWYQSLDTHQVLLALAGDPIRLTSTVRDWISHGHLITAGTVRGSRKLIIPTLSPLALRCFVHNLRERNKEGHLRAALQSILDVEPNFNYTNYEMFHANFEVIRRLALMESNPQMIRLDELYKLDVKNTVEDPDEFFPTIKLVQKEVVKLNTHFPTNIKHITNEKERKIDPYRSIMIPTQNNPAFDNFTFEKSQQGEDVLIHVECRYSKDGAATKTSEKQILDKLALFVKAYKPYVNGEMKGTLIGDMDLKWENIFFVYVAFRSFSKGTYFKSYKVDGVEVKTLCLEEEHLKRFYTPTFSSTFDFLRRTGPTQVYRQ